jgi:hypothetical protein
MGGGDGDFGHDAQGFRILRAAVTRHVGILASLFWPFSLTGFRVRNTNP